MKKKFSFLNRNLTNFLYRNEYNMAYSEEDFVHVLTEVQKMRDKFNTNIKRTIKRVHEFKNANPD